MMENKSMKGRKRRLTFYCLSIAILIVLLGVTAYAHRSDSYRDETVIAKVNGEPVEYREFMQAIKREKDPNRALKLIVRIKLEQIWAKQKGVISRITYHEFIDQWIKENARRKQAVRNGQPIYGPIQYDEQGYYNYIYSNMLIKLKEELGKDELRPSDNLLQTAYEQMKETYYKKPDTITIQKIMLSNIDNTAKARMDHAKTRVDNGEPFEHVAFDMGMKGDNVVQVFDERTAKFNAESYPGLMNKAAGLRVGQISDIFEDNRTWFLIKCIDRQSGGYQTLEEVKQNVKSKLVDQMYEQKLEEMIKQAKLDILTDLSVVGTLSK